MKAEQLNRAKVPIVKIDPSLSGFHGMVLSEKAELMRMKRWRRWGCLKAEAELISQIGENFFISCGSPVVEVFRSRVQ